MTSDEREPPPPYFGDYPGGAYWSAVGPEDPDEAHEVSYSIEGDTIRFMWDYGVVVPLWDGTGLLPEDPEWLRRALGLSDALIADLAAWGRAMDHLDAHPRLRTDAAYGRLDERAKELVARLRSEVGSGIRVTYRPW